MMKNLLIDRDLTSLINNKKLQAILAIVPIALFLLAILSYFGIFFSMFNTLDTQLGHIGNSKSLLTAFLGNLIIFIFLVLMSFFIGIVSFVFFIVHALKNPNLTKNDDRLLWILAIIFSNVFGIFFYWLIQIKRKNPRPIVDLFSNEV
ncbi:PLDc N-terminal domain-containing protein [Chishuiella sp.]|uniref:PLDc N-terminal domain-containing protein n=2 Tax=Chishuiella sp. TaxID=1969467 RepID=UPI0028A6F8E6|nr:PLDc N-terminal domain-containing protein [Chishuiella sp.]